MSRKLMLAVLAVFSASALADIQIGISISMTGQAASLGMSEKNAIKLLPSFIANQKINYIILDDASDPLLATKNIKKLIKNNKVDAIIGASTTANSLAMIDVAAENETPMISLAGSSVVVEPMDVKRYWVFKTAPNDSLMISALAQHMADHHIKKIAFLGSADAYGDNWHEKTLELLESFDLKIVANERFQYNDRSLRTQVHKIINAAPDAILIAGTSVHAAIAQKRLHEKDYRGPIYQTHGAVHKDFLNAGDKELEGTILVASPVAIANQLSNNHPVKKTALEYSEKFAAFYGKENVCVFGAYLWDAGLLLKNAIPQALKKAPPNTKKFRQALRDALEETRNLPGANGIFNMTPTDHQGFDQRARVIVTVKNNSWKLKK